MNRYAKIAVACVLAMIVTAVPCLIKTTPVTMTLFFFLGLPLMGLGLLSYLASVAEFIRQHWTW
ncbi:MAG: hypothetical protein WC969_00205 [Elusimicrobiota bacterium]|jgi:hypothetical protein